MHGTHSQSHICVPRTGRGTHTQPHAYARHWQVMPPAPAVRGSFGIRLMHIYEVPEGGSSNSSVAPRATLLVAARFVADARLPEN